MADDKTLAVYAEHAERYAAQFDFSDDDPHLAAFMARLPERGRVLDLGCGPGTSAAILAERGFKVDAWDASPEMVRVAQRRGLDAVCRGFDDLDAEGVYDGIYANFSLLHAPKAEMPGHLGRIARALKSGGAFHVGLKTGAGEARDGLGRFYAYYAAEEIEDLLADSGFTVLSRATGADAGLDGTVAPWIILLTEKERG